MSFSGFMGNESERGTNKSPENRFAKNVSHFMTSILVGCWSSVSIRRIINKFLNACPFDYKAVAVSWEVERS